MGPARDYIRDMPATTQPIRWTQQQPAPAPLADRVEFLLWVPPEASITGEHEVVPDANVDLLLELSDGREQLSLCLAGSPYYHLKSDGVGNCAT
jgi:hypothetical protein